MLRSTTTHCPHGHAYDGQEEYKRNGRVCKSCDTEPGRCCRGCGEWRTRDEFSLSAWRRLGTVRCKVCVSEMNRRNKLSGRYGLTTEQFESLLAAQCGRCALCGKEQLVEGHPLYVDHDHASGRVRGLLCISCNLALSILGDDAAGLRRAYEYVLGEEAN